MSLDYGDSGTPVFGIRNDGTMVLAAVISRGTSSNMNILSLIDVDSYQVSSDDDDNFTTDFGSEEKMKALEEMSVAFSQHLRDCALNDLNDDKSEDNELVGSSDEDENDGHDQQGNDDGDHDRGHRKGKKRIKSHRKERAFKKRQLIREAKISRFKDMLGEVFRPGDKFDEYVSRFVKGDIIKFNRKRGHELYSNFDSTISRSKPITLDDFCSAGDTGVKGHIE